MEDQIIGDLLKEDRSFHGEEEVAHNGFDLDDLRRMFTDGGFHIEKSYRYHTVKKPDSKGVVRDYGQFMLIAQKAGGIGTANKRQGKEKAV